jgi:hypothetical protein
VRDAVSESGCADGRVRMARELEDRGIPVSYSTYNEYQNDN